MKTNFKFLLLGLLLMPLIALAQTEVVMPDSEGLIIWLTPLIVLGATWLVRLVKSNVSGTITLLIVTVLSGATTWLTSLATNYDGSWLIQFALGLVSVFIHQFYTKFKSQ